MSKQVEYVQCNLKRTISGGLERTTSYIPRQYAKLGRVLKLKDDLNRWVDGWVVESVGGVIVEASRVPDYRKAIRRHRESTGDNQPRRNE